MKNYEEEIMAFVRTECRISMTRACQILGVSLPVVRKAIRNLEEQGVLYRIREGMSTNFYLTDKGKASAPKVYLLSNTRHNAHDGIGTSSKAVIRGSSAAMLVDH